MRWYNRPHCPRRVRSRTPIIRMAWSATHLHSAPTGWELSPLAPAICTALRERNGYLGFALAFPFSSTSKTISGFETYGDNQFVTAITAFPVVRNQEKYQFRYDVSGSVGRHAPKFGVDFIHEPVLSGAFPGQAETTYILTENPTYYLTNPDQLTAELNCLPPFRRHQLPDDQHAGRKRQLLAKRSAPGTLRHGLLARDAATDHQLRPALGHHVWTVPGFGRQSAFQSRGANHSGTPTAAADGCAAGLPQSLRAAPGDRLFSRPS